MGLKVQRGVNSVFQCAIARNVIQENLEKALHVKGVGENQH